MRRLDFLKKYNRRKISKKYHKRQKYLADEARRKKNNSEKNSIRAISLLQKHGSTIGKTDEELYKIWQEINKGG